MDLRDVVNGEGPPPILVLSLVGGLPDDSMFHAMRRGGVEYLGWDQNRMILAQSFDAIRDLTLVSGNWKPNKAPKFKPWPRPWDGKNASGKKKNASVKDLYKKFGGK